MKKFLILLFSVIAIITISACTAEENVNVLKVSRSSDELVGENYQTVISELETIGFTNIKTEVLDDLVTGWLTKDGSVEQVEINGNNDFGNGTKFPKDAEIIITYHTFPKENESDATISVDDNTEDINKGDLENSVEDNSESTNTEKESIYEKGYRVRFQDYDICYLIDEDEHTISIFDTIEEYTDVYTSVYTGDFNNGINFDWNGLKMRAHYNYVDNDATLIIYDESGNENKALNLGVDIIEGYIKLRPNDN